MRLEIGPGAGKYRFSPRIRGDDVIYLDISLPGNSSSNWVRADAQHLPFKNGVFEEVVASHVIEHLENPALFLKECYRVLKKEGVLRLWCPNVFSKNMYRDNSHVFKANPYSLKKLLVKAGFEAHFDCPAVGSLFPRFFRFMLRALYLMLANDVRVIAWKR